MLSPRLKPRFINLDFVELRLSSQLTNNTLPVVTFSPKKRLSPVAIAKAASTASKDLPALGLPAKITVSPRGNISGITQVRPSLSKSNKSSIV